MSDTDNTDPIWVRLNDRRREVRASHSRRCHRTGGAECDLPPWPVDKHHLDTVCGYRATAGAWRLIYGGSYFTPPSRQPFRDDWFASDRAAQRRIALSLTRDAMYGGEVDEDVIDNRQTHRLAMWGGGWWD
ncbi:MULTISPECIES: hypothetical protein [Mycolicibacterium]|uniref:Uncharacterized protein n=1 Tax=Mycolicibacterium senegalense TaxID=1796 RepID=A0A378T383_9MYCO|nr:MULTISPECIES: hypothetical protein [Mycolicibacterium]MCV7335355.1 hypothetical protein [Mycolicibacterium senegalense]MDR7290691.1 hypothetical protein [Mycolicibacterium senegalense]QZA22261.1 hypothetical protein K3U95_15925 [Mycolicibacterium senegalense]CDP89234.1 hypothetical protein BN975_05085 [Mycolicibacterium farcinogenes]STZ53956.1 Uncharacterised protein [Mycolicibacterium senegalense]